MKFMTPKQYGQLLFKVFFKGRSLSEETKDWIRKDIAKGITHANIYTFIFSVLIMAVMEMISWIYGFQFYFIKAVMGVALSFVVSVLGSIIIRELEMGVVFGITFGIVLGIIMGVALDVSERVVFGIAVGIPFGFVVGIAVGAKKMDVLGGIVWGIAAVISYGISWGIVLAFTGFCCVITSYFLVWSRWYYLPVFLIVFFKEKGDPRKLPSHWDENIGAPLPFLDSVLHYISRHDRAAAVNEAIYLIRERPSQRKAAQRVLVRIAIDEMIQFRDLRNMARLRQELHFLPQDKVTFPEFYIQDYEEISLFSDDAQTALNELNPSNRLRMLERLAANMREFQKKMDFAPRKIGVPFGRIASRWLEIVKKEIKQIEADVGRPLPNPFIVGRPIDPESEIFVGRRDIIEQIQQEALRKGGAGAILFFGSRRTGKTSTLLNLKRHVLTSLKPVFFDCQSFSQVSYFTRDTTRSIHLALGHEKEKVKHCNSLDELTEYLQLIQDELRTRNQHLLLCFDEYERLTEKIVSGEFAGLPDAFRHWVQHLPRTICLFAGSHALNEIEQIDWTDYFINVRTVRISFLDFDSALRLVTEPIPRFDLQYEPNIETAKELVRRLSSQPFLLQATMSELVNYLNTLRRKTATQADIDIAIEKLFESQSTYFDHIWKTETSDPEKEVLQAIIKQQPAPQASDPAVRSLIRKEVLRKEDNELVFCVPVFREWIKKSHLS